MSIPYAQVMKVEEVFHSIRAQGVAEVKVKGKGPPMISMRSNGAARRLSLPTQQHHVQPFACAGLLVTSCHCSVFSNKGSSSFKQEYTKLCHS